MQRQPVDHALFAAPAQPYSASPCSAHCRHSPTLVVLVLMSLCVQEDCARVLMFRGAEKELKNSTGHSAYQVAIAASYHNLADAIQKFKPEDIGENRACLCRLSACRVS